MNMTACKRSQIADTCPLCQRLYAAHTLAHTLYVGEGAIVYVTCDSRPWPPAWIELFGERIPVLT